MTTPTSTLTPRSSALSRPDDSSASLRALLANNLVPAGSPARPAPLVNGWLRALERSNTPTFRPVPAQLLPPSQNRPQSNAPLTSILAPGSRMRYDGLPPLDQDLLPKTVFVVESALSREWLEQFKALSPERQEVARGLLWAVMAAAQEKTWKDGWLAPRYIPDAVRLVLSSAQQWGQPAPTTTAPTARLTTEQTRPQRGAEQETRRTLPQPVSTAAPLPLAAGTAGTAPAATKPAPSARAPITIERWKPAIGQVSVALETNINAPLRGILNDLQSGRLQPSAYDATANRAEVVAQVQGILTRDGDVPVVKARAAAENLLFVAQALNIDPPRLAREVTRRIQQGRELAASVNPRNPLLVDARDANSLKRAENYFTAVYSQGIGVPAQTRSIDGHDVSIPEMMLPTPTMTDLDGVLARSYGEFGLEVQVVDRAGKHYDVYLPLGKALEGTPTQIRGVEFRPGQSTVVVNLEVRNAETNEVVNKTVKVPVTPEQAGVLLSASNTTVTGVEGLTARYFPAPAMQLLRAVSERDGRGAEFPGGVKANEFIGNTFGTAGERPADSSRPGELVRSIARSDNGITVFPLELGFPAVPNFGVYSGGAARTDGQSVQALFGLDPKDAQGIKAVARQLPVIVEELGKKYRLTNEQIADWNRVNFTNADIPSIILPASVFEALAKRGDDAELGLANLQGDIETKIQTLIASQGIAGKYRVHHTPSRGNDELALARFDASGKLIGPVTTEWQINVKGGKALPVLDVLARRLQKDHGVDLLGDLKSRGYDWSRMREMELPELIAFFKTVVRPMIEARAQALGHPLTGKMIVQVDTFGQTIDAAGNIKLVGSDSSLVEGAMGLYGEDNVVIVQVDTLGGKPSDKRQPAFDMQVDASGRLVLKRPSVAPTSEGSPIVYVSDPETLGRVLNNAYRNQLPLPQNTASPVRR